MNMCWQKLCVANCSQTAADRDTVLLTAYKTHHRPIQRYYRRLPTTYRRTV